MNTTTRPRTLWRSILLLCIVSTSVVTASVATTTFTATDRPAGAAPGTTWQAPVALAPSGTEPLLAVGDSGLVSAVWMGVAPMLGLDPDTITALRADGLV